MPSFEEIKHTAISEGWSRKQIRNTLYQEPALWERRDEMLAACGLATTADNLAKEAAEKAQREATARVQHEAAEAEAARAAAVAAELNAQAAEKTQREAAAAAAAAADLAAYRAEEWAALADVEPHWPTYRKVLRLAEEAQEAADAAHYGDVGDYLAYKHAAPALDTMAELVLLDDRSVAADILRRTGGEMTEQQAKLVALTLAKLATKHGMTGTAPLSPDTAHRLEGVSEELEEFAVSLDRDLPQYCRAVFAASKKTGSKPYLAKLGQGFTRNFARGTRATNTTRQFCFDGLRVGDVLEMRGYSWDGAAYTGGVQYAAIGAGAIYFVSRRTAQAIVDGARSFSVDHLTRVLRLTPDAQVPAELPQPAGVDFAAFLTTQDGAVLNVRWPDDEEV